MHACMGTTLLINIYNLVKNFKTINLIDVHKS